MAGSLGMKMPRIKSMNQVNRGVKGSRSPMMPGMPRLTEGKPSVGASPKIPSANGNMFKNGGKVKEGSKADKKEDKGKKEGGRKDTEKKGRK